MARTSPSTLALDSISQCLTAAAEAARKLDTSASEDLRSLLRIAGSETDRVRKASRRRTAKKPAAIAKSAKKPVKRVPVAAMKTASRTKGRRRVTVNGATH